MSEAAPSLQRPTLVLNRSWVPIYTVTARKAMVWLYRDVAHAIHERHYTIHDFSSWVQLSEISNGPYVRTPSLKVCIPEVVKMVSYNGIPENSVAFTRKALFYRDKYRCQYCGEFPGVKELTIDHVMPVSRGGRSNWENCVLACVRCNAKKGNRTPAESGMRLLKRPLPPKWTPLHSISRKKVLKSWQNFISDAYWNTLLEE